MARKNVLTMVAMALAVAGCASGYQDSYQATDLTKEVIAARRAAPAPAEPVVERASANDENLQKELARRGYTMMGTSAFYSSGNQSDDLAIAQARSVGADLVVIIDPKLTDKAISRLPNTSRPYKQDAAENSSAMSGDPPPTAFGYMPTYGTQGRHRYRTLDKMDYVALYLVKLRPTEPAQ